MRADGLDDDRETQRLGAACGLGRRDQLTARDGDAERARAALPSGSLKAVHIGWRRRPVAAAICSSTPGPERQAMPTAAASASASSASR